MIYLVVLKNPFNIDLIKVLRETEIRINKKINIKKNHTINSRQNENDMQTKRKKKSFFFILYYKNVNPWTFIEHTNRLHNSRVVSIEFFDYAHRNAPIIVIIILLLLLFLVIYLWSLIIFGCDAFAWFVISCIYNFFFIFFVVLFVITAVI